jgi:hypothetical protein
LKQPHSYRTQLACRFAKANNDDITAPPQDLIAVAHDNDA